MWWRILTVAMCVGPVWGCESSDRAETVDEGAEQRPGTPPGDCQGIFVERRSSTVHPPAGLRVVFRVMDCNAEPVRALTEADVTIINDITGAPFGDGGEGGGASAPSTPSSYGLFSVLSLDMSGSVFQQNAQGAVFDAAEAFIRAMVEDAPEGLQHRIAIQVFGRTAETRIVQDFTDDLATLLAQLDTLRSTQESLGSTNLYGAYQQALQAVLAQGRNLELVERSVVFFTDGVHEASNPEPFRTDTLAAKRAAEENNNVTAFSVYLGAEAETDAIQAIRELASAGESDFRVASADNVDELTEAFEGFARKLQGIARSNYVVGVCTPVELGEGRLTVTVNVDGATDSTTVTYPTNQLTGDVRPESCDVNELIRGGANTPS